jgi:DMSO/TMAO reductase YedYZ molybdopterin-dependent catalytic subunit
MSVFGEGPLTPNNAFFVRYHLSDIPLSIDPSTFTLTIEGKVRKPLKLTLDELKSKFKTSELVAVAQCVGNGRGLFNPRVGGGQWGNGAMGCAIWRGAKLSDLLDAAGVEDGARQAVFDGLDRPVLDKTPDFSKALDLGRARDGALVAWSMNGEDLPMLNGYPLRLVVPGWYATYWVKHLSRITVLDHEYDGFWMKTAYRAPDNDCACVEPGSIPAKTRPVSKMNVRSFVTNLESGARLKRGDGFELKGIAFDGGSGIREVAVSVDGGASWKPAELGEDLGPFAFRPWSARIAPPRGKATILARATARSGETQPMDPRWNPTGYMRNVVERVETVFK